MRIGINFTHDSSVVITDSSGTIIVGMQEERLTRVKNTTKFPFRALEECLSFARTVTDEELQSIHFGTEKPYGGIKRVGLSFDKREFPAFDGQYGYIFPPGFRERLNGFAKLNEREIFHVMLTEVFRDLKEDLNNCEIYFENHQRSHAASAWYGSTFESALVLSLDGHGDGDSGGCFVGSPDGSLVRLSRFSELNSFGHLYASVTQRYNFKPLKHEGKITGLAAYGEYSGAAEFLKKHISIENGVPKFAIASSRRHSQLIRMLREFGLGRNSMKDVLELIEIAESKTNEYSDLAYAVQNVLELSVIEILDFWAEKTNLRTATFAGGVFANVKLNQKIRESGLFADFYVFPAMGDSGIAAGAIWSTLSREGIKSKTHLSDVFIGPESNSDVNLDEFAVEYLDPANLSERIVNSLMSQKLVGLILGRMEFGPRALGNRTLLIDPRDAGINVTVNKRLSRTEFMPFAPICLEDDFLSLFHVESAYQNFKYMTETCEVKDEYKAVFPAAIHVDGTARPQFLPQGSNPLLESVIKLFKFKTSCPVLINTSLNIHEEPIVSDLIDALKALKTGQIDALATENQFITIKS
jgi:carbamoyltransferase